MTAEVTYIIKNKKFKQTWDDNLIYWEFLIPLLALISGASLITEGTEFSKYLFGTILIVATIPLTKFVVLRRRQLNQFEELNNTRTKEENFEQCLIGLKTLNIVETDKDIHNWIINAKYKSSWIPPVYEWLTIVCLDNKILVNSRPTPTTLIMWFRRNAMIDFKKVA